MYENVRAYDTETHRFSVGNLSPNLVCVSVAGYYPEANPTTPEGARNNMGVEVVAITTPEKINAVIDSAMAPGVKAVFHNAAFDLAVIANHRPDLISRIFEKITLGEVSCTKIREKLLNVNDTGDLEFMVTRTGARQKIGYSLADLSAWYLGTSRHKEKQSPDSWRTNFAVLAPIPIESWPVGAVEYAGTDAADALAIWALQECRAAELKNATGVHPFMVESFRVGVDFALYLCSCWGVCVDPVQKGQIEAEMERELSPEHLNLLIEANILRPGSPARTNKKGAKDHIIGCRKRWVENGRTVDCDCPVKTVAAVPPSINTAALHSYVTALAAANPNIKLRYTKPSDKFPEGQLSIDAEFLEDFAHLDPVLTQLQHRQSLQKLVTTELPRMNWEGRTSPIIHPCFDVVKETGRTSSFASELYPSFNCQNVDPRARKCIVPRPGYLMFSIDYSSMELGTLAQRCLDLFGRSVMAEMINKGYDLHGYLGAQIAYYTHDAFRSMIDNSSACGRPEDIYLSFNMFKESADPNVKAFYEHFRTWAKPTGLGYPGGLGPQTFIAYSKKIYGIQVDLATAKQLREIWMTTFPEMVEYFKYINECCEDTRNGPKVVKDDDGNESLQKLYKYTTPFGMLRSGATYCAAANGFGLQSPSAEGALLALFSSVRACYDPAMGSILYSDDLGITTRITMFIHDELCGEVRDDDRAADRVSEIGKLMVEAMKTVTPDVKPRVEMALMRRWDKKAKPVFDSKGKLTVWEPKK